MDARRTEVPEVMGLTLSVTSTGRDGACGFLHTSLGHVFKGDESTAAFANSLPKRALLLCRLFITSQTRRTLNP